MMRRRGSYQSAGVFVIRYFKTIWFLSTVIAHALHLLLHHPPPPPSAPFKQSETTDNNEPQHRQQQQQLRKELWVAQ